MALSERSQKIIDEVRANLATLQGCEGPHDFIDDPHDVRPVFLRKKFCTKCGGRIDRLEVLWYERGLYHGRLHRS